MDGIFIKTKSRVFFNIIGIFCGVFLVFLFGFFLYSGQCDTLDYQILSIFFVCFGISASCFCAVSLYVNRKAYIHVDEDRISAFCHFGLALECEWTDIRYVSYGGTGLTLQLKNGKKYNLMNLENADQLGRYIQKRIPGELLHTPDQRELTTALPELQKRCKKEGIASIACFLLIFPLIFGTAALTDWKDLHEFTSRDWTVFAWMAGLGVIVLIAFSILLRRFLLDGEEITRLRGARHQQLLRTAPLQPGNAIKLFLDDDVYATVRLTVYGFPHYDDVYFTVEGLNQHLELECIHRSAIYADFSELEPEIEGMTEIPLP